MDEERARTAKVAAGHLLHDTKALGEKYMSDRFPKTLFNYYSQQMALYRVNICIGQKVPISTDKDKGYITVAYVYSVTRKSQPQMAHNHE